MQKAKAIRWVLLGVVLAVFIPKIFQEKTHLDKQILNTKLSESVSIIGYRNNVGNATVPFRYYFYVMQPGDDLPTPFLVTNTADVKIIVNDETDFSLSVQGTVHRFTNAVWVKQGHRLIPITIRFTTEKLDQTHE